MKYTTHSQQETINLGKKISPTLRRGDVVCLYGELGAGKTTLVKGIAEGLGVKEDIKSPTFTLMNVYDCHSRESGNLGRPPLNDMDPRLSPPQRDPALWRWRGDDIVAHPLKFVHIDTYRLKNAEELVEIGAEDYLGQADTMCVVEWPEKIEDILRGKNLVKIMMEHGEGNERRITKIKTSSPNSQ